MVTMSMILTFMYRSALHAYPASPHPPPQLFLTMRNLDPANSPVATAMNAPIIQNAELNQQFISKIPVGRWGTEEEVAQLALYLCSQEAGFVTGTDILIDGGWTAQ